MLKCHINRIEEASLARKDQWKSKDPLSGYHLSIVSIMPPTFSIDSKM